MSSMFTWVDFAEDDRRKMADVIALFSEKDTRDELGLGGIRDTFADLLFPATSTIQTGARYFLFIPWIYGELERRRTLPADIERFARRDEIRLIHALEKDDETDGIIGTLAQDKLARLPSSIYWAGLGRLGIRRFEGSQEQYNIATLRPFTRHPGADCSPKTSRPPKAPRGVQACRQPSPALERTTFALTKREAKYLTERIWDFGPTVFGIHMTPNRLGNLAYNFRGPKYELVDRQSRHRWVDVVSWVRQEFPRVKRLGKKTRRPKPAASLERFA